MKTHPVGENALHHCIYISGMAPGVCSVALVHFLPHRHDSIEMHLRNYKKLHKRVFCSFGPHLDFSHSRPIHYTIVMGDFNAKVGGQTNTSERATGCFGLGQRNERGDTLVEWATSKNFKIMNKQFQKKAGRRWTWRSPDGNTKNEIDYIMTDKPSLVTDMTVINRVNIGSDHRMVMSSITLTPERKGGSF